MKKVLMIINPCAGKNSKRVNTGDIVRAFRAKNIDCFEKTTTCRGDATEIAKKYAADYDAVVCCGGDGTYNEVVNGMMLAKSSVPILYLPYGSTNDFANTLGIKKDPAAIAQMYVDNMVNGLDVGSFNDKFFTYVASFGVGTEISYGTSQKVKNKLGHAAYIINGFIVHLIPIVANLHAIPMKIEYDGGVIEDKFLFGAVSNTNEVSGIFKFDKCGIKMNDGIFEVLLVKNLKVSSIGSVFTKLLRQNYDDDNLIMFKTDKLKITSEEEVPWTLDGEYGGAYTEMDISVCPKAVNVVTPKGPYID